jgi:hypothetical protein
MVKVKQIMVRWLFAVLLGGGSALLLGMLALLLALFQIPLFHGWMVILLLVLVGGYTFYLGVKYLRMAPVAFEQVPLYRQPDIIYALLCLLVILANLADVWELRASHSMFSPLILGCGIGALCLLIYLLIAKARGDE